jgi:hypothetical protein
MNARRTGETVLDGQAIPEAEVDRAAPSKVFQARAAVTVRQGSRRRRPAAEAAAAGRPMQTRAAVTEILPPPHWAHLRSAGETPAPPVKEEEDHAHAVEPDADRRQA